MFYKTFIITVLSSTLLFAQNNPGEYMTKINDLDRAIMDDYMSYSSAVSHGKSARKVENRRKSMMESIKVAIKEVSAMKPFEGDKSLKDSSLAFLRLTYDVLNNDFSKILNLEEISEQSYDAMEAYLTAQDMANDKLNVAGEKLSAVEKTFAASHKVNLIVSENDKLSIKLKKNNSVNTYYRQPYLTFFKSYKQELYLQNAIDSKDLNSIEQNRSALALNAKEGLAKFESFAPFENDNSLIVAGKDLMKLYITEANEKVAISTKYLIKVDEFNKIKKAFEAKKEAERTQQDVNVFNKAVAEVNEQTNIFNKNNTDLYNQKSKYLNNWNNAVSNFFDKHVPKHR